jgi:UDP-N-acetylmuramyl pentapeptide phosphotransferase/UDP-N-acetylglucosamine-1-phosphate transferase
MKDIYTWILIGCVSTILIFILKNNFFFRKKLSTKDEFISGHNKEIKITGLGIVFVPIFILIFLLYFYFDVEINYPNRFWYFILMLTVISLISFKDDIKSLDPVVRLFFHFICVYVSVSTLDLSTIPYPLKVKILVAIFVWVYLINITNFIDGSDGFCLQHVISFFVGILLINYIFNLNLFSATIAKILIPMLLSFLIFNIPPAKIYMGDSGSIFLGFLVGYSFLEISIKGYLLYALALYAYPIIDCSFTLTKKVLKGYLPWARHGDYFFLKLKRKNKKKDMVFVSFFIFFTSLFLNFINLVIVYLSIKFNGSMLLFCTFFTTLILIFLYQYLYKSHVKITKKIYENIFFINKN